MNLYFHLQNLRVPLIPYPWWQLELLVKLFFSQAGRYVQWLVVLVCTPMLTNELIFIYLVVIWKSSLVKWLFKSPTFYQTFSYSFIGFNFTFWIQTFCYIYIANIFSYSCALYFPCFNDIIWWTDVLFWFFIVRFIKLLFYSSDVFSLSFLLTLRLWKYSLMLAFQGFIVLPLTFRSINPPKNWFFQMRYK